MGNVRFNDELLDGTVEVSQGDVTDTIRIGWLAAKVKTLFVVFHDNTGTIELEIKDQYGNWHTYAGSELDITNLDRAYPIEFRADNREVRIHFMNLAGDTTVTAWTEQR